ncbi:prepilin-type N-terminal cleavage/methylation domain-containing protein, partial [Caulobacter sp. 17J65-9]|uniref:prepilin-type N-terminal cleavage/methylation domain-containing protein n=1 Tax=Caulobacter sp. 17J65-9 TaxID=2709382 RepID=UPI0013C6BEBA
MTPSARRGERGFSLVETLIGVAVAALVAALVLPMATRAVRDNFALADRGLDQADRAAAEAQFRRLLQSAGPLRGDGATVDLTADLDEPVACAPAGADVGVRLQIVA